MVLYDELGGATGVATALDRFYPKVLADPTMSRFFDGVDIEDLKKRIGSFMAMALGGQSDYRGPALRDVHGRMGISDETFDRFVGCFEGILTELGAGTDQITQVLVILNGARGEILNR
ncbi:MAG: group I truncated hemoglobin [Gaiellaceae bacterium]